MRKYQTETITGIAEVTAERVRLGGEILQALAHAVAANEKTQRRFRNAVLIRLANIEMMVSMILVDQMAKSQGRHLYYADKLREDADAAQEFVSEKSKELGLAMINYIYGEEAVPDSPGKKRRKRSKASPPEGKGSASTTDRTDSPPEN